MALTLRNTKGSKLTIEEMDGNFTYLQALSLSGSLSGSSAVTASYALTASRATTASYAVTASMAQAITGSNVPAGSGSAGSVGQVAMDGNYFYYCYAANNWGRISGSLFW